MADEREHQSGDRALQASMNYEAPGSAYPHPDRERMPGELAAGATARRLEREETFVRNTTVAGHDFRREHQERERGR